MPFRIDHAVAAEILDSRGRPTLEVEVVLADGARGTAGVPSGASTGTREAVERRDGDPARFAGAGVLGAVAAVNGEISDELARHSFASLAEVDAALCALDGTPGKARLGANAIVGVSMATTRAIALARGVELHRDLVTGDVEPRLPVPHFNVLNGGRHAQNPLAFQEFMIAPIGAPSFAEALRVGAEIYAALRRLLSEHGFAVGLGDEGGFAPGIATPEQALDLLVGAITAAGYTPARDQVAIAIDPAASEFRAEDGRYAVAPGELLTSAEIIDRYRRIVDAYPVWSIEDGLAEHDWDAWQRLTEALGDRVQLVGDDILVTDPATIRRAIADRVGNAALIKLNQIGTVSETLDAIATARDGGFAQMVSHRSGETPDAFIADLAFASGCGQIKAGAPARGERVAKYNRLLAIERRQPGAPYGLVPVRTVPTALSSSKPVP